MMIFKEYKFRDVYEFANIINKYVENEIDFYAYDREQFIQAAIKCNKKSLLHIYIYTQLLNHYNREYFKNCDCYEYDTYNHWVDVASSYNIQFKSQFHEESDTIFDWYKENEELFYDLFQEITNEVFYILFHIHPFLEKFNKIVAKLIKNEDDERDWNFPVKYIKTNGTLKRSAFPKWAKDAVFHRDHCKCVFCGKDLTGMYSHSNKVNYDHIIPLNQYGSNDPCNLQTTCEECNKAKSDRLFNPKYKYEPWW